MQEETTTPKPQPGELDVSSTDSNETGSDVAIDDETGEEIVKQVNDGLNKNFKDSDAITKSLQDASAKISDQGTTIKELQTKLNLLVDQNSDNVGAEVAKLRDELNQEKFYQKNAEYDTAEIRAVLGSNPAERMKDDSFKAVVEGKVAADKAENAKSVLQSNPRLGQARDNITKARELSGEGNDKAANEAAVSAVLEAFSD